LIIIENNVTSLHFTQNVFMKQVSVVHICKHHLDENIVLGTHLTSIVLKWPLIHVQLFGLLVFHWQGSMLLCHVLSMFGVKNGTVYVSLAGVCYVTLLVL
jgi:hypothetical protein